MQKPQFAHSDYTTLGSTYQLVLPLNVEFRIPKDDLVRLLRHIIEGKHAPDHATIARFQSLHLTAAV